MLRMFVLRESGQTEGVYSLILSIEHLADAGGGAKQVLLSRKTLLEPG